MNTSKQQDIIVPEREWEPNEGRAPDKHKSHPDLKGSLRVRECAIIL